MIGIVMEEHTKYIIVMTPDSRFIKLKKTRQSYSIGEEISFPLETESNSIFSKKWFNMPSFRTVLVPLLIFALVFVPFLYQNGEEKAFAYVSVDINPSLNVSVNKEMKAIDIEAINKDGKEVLHSLKGWKNKDINVVTNMILEQSELEGYLKNEKEVLISIAFTEKSNLSQSQEKNTFKAFKNELTKIADNRDVSLTTFQITEDMHEKAKNKNISPNKYIIVQTAKEKGIQLKMEDVKSQSINEIAKKLGNLNSFINKEKSNSSVPKKQIKKETVPSPLNQEKTNENPNTTSSQQEKGTTPKKEVPKTKSNNQNTNAPKAINNIKSNIHNSSNSKKIEKPKESKSIQPKSVQSLQPVEKVKTKSIQPKSVQSLQPVEKVITESIQPIEPSSKNNQKNKETKQIKVNDIKVKIDKK